MVHIVGAGDGTCVAQQVFPVAGGCLLGCDYAVGRIYAWIHRLDGCVKVRPFYIASDDVVAFGQRDNLFEVEGIFDDGERSRRGCLLIFSFGREGAFGDSQFELLVAFRALKDQDAPRLVACFVKGDDGFTFGASDTFHLR